MQSDHIQVQPTLSDCSRTCVSSTRLGMIAEAAKRLLASIDGAEVVQFLRDELQASAQAAGRPYSVNTLKTYVSHVRRKVLEAEYRNPHCDFSPLMAAAGDSDVAAFVSAPLKQQVEMQRRHRRQPCWSDAAEDALQCIELLPANMASFHITEREVRLIKRRDKSNLRERMADVTVVADGQALLARATDLLRSAVQTDGYGTLLAPLLLVSGRREVEILNVCSGRSCFQKVGCRSVLFTGQAKTKCSEGAPAFVIPLLCEADSFLFALTALQAKRGDLSHLDNQQVHVLMNSCFTASQLHAVLPMLPEGSKWHLLRSLYLQYVHHCYDHTMAVNHLAKRILGHFDEAESLRYVSTRVDGMDAMKGVFGPLDLSVAAAE